MTFSNPNRVHVWRKNNPSTLDGSSTYLKEVPMEDILSYPDLSIIRYMDLSRNFLEILPDSFAPGLVQLEKLNLSSNFIRFLPANFGTLHKLIILDCRDNAIRRLPSSFANLTNLFWLDLSFNPLVLTLAQVNDNDQDNWSSEGCQKAAKEVVRVIGQLNKIRAEELRPVLVPQKPVWNYGRHRTRKPVLQMIRLDPEEAVVAEVNGVGSSTSGKIKFTDETSDSASDEEDRQIFQVSGPYSQANGRELCGTQVRNSVMKTETLADTIGMENRPRIWTILYGFKILLGIIVGGLVMCLLLVCFVDRTKIDRFVDNYFGFLPTAVLDWFSFVLYYMQFGVTMVIPALPLIKDAKPVRFVTKLYNFARNTFDAFVDYFVSPHNFPLV